MLRILRQYYPIRNAFFVLGEGTAIFLSVLIAASIFYEELPGGLFVKAMMISFVCQMCLYYNDLYSFGTIESFVKMGVSLVQALCVAAVFLAIIFFIPPFSKIEIINSVYLVSLCFLIVFVVSWRFFYDQVLKRGIFNQKIIILGSGELARNIYGEIINTRDCGYVVEYVALESPDDKNFVDDKISKSICRKNHEGLCEIAHDHGIKKIVVALREQRGNFPMNELLKCRVDGINIIRGNTFYEMLTGKLSVEHINPAWLIYSVGFRNTPVAKFLKRVSDILLSLFMLITLSPIFLITAIFIKIDSKGPVFFSQERVGEKRKPYRIHKFRSMVQDAEEKSGPVWAQQNDSRITRVGNFIRKWRVDELPQLWNVLKGEMSFTGPRPEREFFVKGLEYIIPYYRERFAVKPGITGWAQVNYPYGASVKDATEKLNYDLFYMKNMSLLLDFVIVIRTVKTVVFGKGR